MADAARGGQVGAGFDCTFGFDVDTGNDVGRDRVRIGASACRRGQTCSSAQGRRACQARSSQT